MKFAKVLISEHESVLKCPRCGDDYLQHDNTLIFQRDEDEEQVTIISTYNVMPDQIDPGYDMMMTRKKSTVLMNVEDNSEDNPSPRRQGLVILFRCEYCEDDSELTIAQHKGQTLIRWRYT